MQNKASPSTNSSLDVQEKVKNQTEKEAKQAKKIRNWKESIHNHQGDCHLAPKLYFRFVEKIRKCHGAFQANVPRVIAQSFEFVSSNKWKVIWSTSTSNVLTGNSLELPWPVKTSWNVTRTSAYLRRHRQILEIPLSSSIPSHHHEKKITEFIQVFSVRKNT